MELKSELNVDSASDSDSDSEVDSEIDSKSEALVDLDCLNDLMADCDAGVDSACEEIISKPGPCRKDKKSSQPSFKAPTSNKPKSSKPEVATASPSNPHQKKPQFTHSEKKMLDHIDGDCMPYQGNNVAKISLSAKTTQTPKAVPTRGSTAGCPIKKTEGASASKGPSASSTTIPNPLKQ